jgi:membrane associated rhomboid family serine protease
VRTAFGGRIEGEQGLVTRVLIGINVGVFILTALASALISADNAIAVLAGRSVDSPLYEWFSMVPYRLLWDRDTVVDGVAQGQVWRLFTAGFLHYGIIHLLLNMWALWVLGREVERMVGRWRYLAVYLLSGLGGAVTAYAFGATNAAVAGASGSIFGLFGALFFFFRKLNLDPRGLILIIALNFGLGFVIPSISILGHLGGLVVGAATGALLAYAPRGPNRAFFQITGLVVIGLAVAVVAALRTIQLTAI